MLPEFLKIQSGCIQYLVCNSINFIYHLDLQKCFLCFLHVIVSHKQTINNFLEGIRLSFTYCKVPLKSFLMFLCLICSRTSCFCLSIISRLNLSSLLYCQNFLQSSENNLLFLAVGLLTPSKMSFSDPQLNVINSVSS